jgi:hypothetical protein
MPANNPRRAPRRPPRPRQKGAAGIEFALLAGLFFTLVLGIIEVARLMFIYNTLQEVTRSAAAGAANVYALDTAAIQMVKQKAIFRDSPGGLILAPSITDANIRIEYLALKRDSVGNQLSLANIDESSLPSCAAQNRQICMRNPNADNCIRFVQVSVCDTAVTGSCSPVKSTMLIPMPNMTVALHRATTIVPAESLGYSMGMSTCP